MRNVHEEGPAPPRPRREPGRPSGATHLAKHEERPPVKATLPGTLAGVRGRARPQGGYSGLKFSLVAPQMGQVQEDGRASNLVPGLMSLSGSPAAGS